MQRRAGFTLMELLIAMLVAAVLVALAAPSFKSLLARRSVDAAVTNLTTDFRFARSEAVRRNHFVTICRSSDGLDCEASNGSWREGWIVILDANRNGAVDAGGPHPQPDQILRAQGALPGVASVQAAGGGDANRRYTFRGDGLAVGPGSSLEVTADADPKVNRRLLCVSGTGRIALKDPGVARC